MSELRIGIDVGGTGIKGAIVDVSTGDLNTDRLRLETPKPATVESVVAAVASVVETLDHPGPVGVGIPAVVVKGIALTAANIDPGWIGTDVAGRIRAATGRQVSLVNDADAAGLAEASFGAARGVAGKVLVLTFGTGIGSALMMDGVLVPNFELGQIEFEGVRPAELEFSARAREELGLDWDEWGDRTARYLEMVDTVVNPDLTVFGGGACKEWEHFHERIPAGLNVVQAQLLNNAGIVGASLVAG
ncbi:MAG: polyphosphate--glucose phosphotransferase [Acidimicrobiia bacterium]